MKWNNFTLCIAASMLIVNSGTALAGPIRTFADLSAAILDLAKEARTLLRHQKTSWIQMQLWLKSGA